MEEVDDADWRPTWLDQPRGSMDKRTVEAEAFNALLNQHLLTEDWTCDASGWTFRLNDVVIEVINVNLEAMQVFATSNTMSRRFLDPLRAELRHTLDICPDPDWNTTGFAITLLQLVEEAAYWQLLWQSQAAPKNRDPLETKKPLQGWDSRAVRAWNTVVGNPYGVDLSSIEDTALDLLGKPIADICSQVSKDYRILHVEPVFRSDLVAKFLQQRDKIHSDLLTMHHQELRESVSEQRIKRGSGEDTVKGLARELARPSVTFHGAPRQVIQSIVRYGFIIPGSEIGHTGKQLEVRCGSTFGNGIYTSPDALYASHYSGQQDTMTGKKGFTRPSDVPGMRLIVCATLMGRPFNVDYNEARGVSGVLHKRAHSHVGSNFYQYVVFQSAQIIPCYVLHLDYGAEHAQEATTRIAAGADAFFLERKREKTSIKKIIDEDERCPGDTQRKKQALKAAAAKWFPYGYGPSQGTSFVIEDMADVSDDEEDFGDFQHERVEQENEIRERPRETGGSWFDEYQTVRKTKNGA